MSKSAKRALLTAKDIAANRVRFLKGSKAPSRLYHGTTAPEDFSIFNVGEPHHDESGEGAQRQGSGADPTTYLGSHFAEEPEVANKFAKGLYGERVYAISGNRVYPVHLSVKNPHITTEEEMHNWMLAQEYNHPDVDDVLAGSDDAEGHRYTKDKKFRAQVNYVARDLDTEHYSLAREMADRLREHLKSKGHDGIKYKNEVEGGTSWVAFDPRQIKSAIGNRGTFDPNDPDITKAHGGTVKRAVMIARDHQNLLRRVANIYPGPGGGLDPSPGGGGYGGPGGGKYIGPLRLAVGGRADENDDIWWHGSGSGDLRGGESGLHLGTQAAAEDALNARIGFPAEGSWDGTREYGSTKLAGKKSILKRNPYGVSGHNVDAPDEDYFPHEHPNGFPKVSHNVAMKPEWRPNIAGYRIKGPMTNTTSAPHGDWKANGLMKGALKKGTAKRGYFYKNEGEDFGSISAVVPSGAHVEPVKRASGGPIPPFKLKSGAADLIEKKGQAKATPQQYAAMPGIKPDELKWSGYDQAHAGKKLISKADLVQHFNETLPALQETVLGGYNRALDENGHISLAPPKYEQYTLPGGKNYREVLLHLPKGAAPNFPQTADLEAAIEHSAQADEAYRALDKQLHAALDVYQESPENRQKLLALRDKARDALRLKEATEQKYRELREAERQHNQKHRIEPFMSSHWDDPNVLAHVRMSDRKGPNGEKVLHVEEVQSDWGQKGREEGFATPGQKKYEVYNRRSGNRSQPFDTQAEAQKYFEKLPASLKEQLEVRDFDTPDKPGIPRGPYVDNTQKWTDLALKRVLHEAAHGGYDKVVVTPGEEQNKRYSLEHKVKNIRYYPEEKYFHATTHDNRGVEEHDVSEEKLAGLVGKEVAQRLLQQPTMDEYSDELGAFHELEGKDLKVGGAGMKGYYDNILPKRLQTLAQQHDPKAQVQLGSTPIAEDTAPLHSLDVTPQMRDSIRANGFNQFKRGGDVKPKWVNPLEEAAAASGHTPESLYPRLRKYSTDTINKLSDITPSSDWKNLAVLRSREALAPHKPLDPHKMIGSTLISAPGDLLATDMTIHGIGGNVFKNPVHLPGGPFYSRGKSGSAWASAEKAIADQIAAAKEAERQGSPAYHVPISMSRGAISSTPAVWSLLSEMIPFAKINKAGAAIIDKSIKTHPHPETGEPLFPKAPSIRHKDFPDWVSNLNLANRYQLMRAIEKSKNVVAGLPEPGVIRMASIEPEYLAPRSMSAGRVLSKLDPSAGIVHEPEVPHPGYPKQAKGTYHGGFERPAPVGLLFPKAWKTIAGNLDPEIAEVPNPIQRKLQLTTQTQRVTPELADQLAAYYERMRGKPFKQGGVVNRALNIARKVNAR